MKFLIIIFFIVLLNSSCCKCLCSFDAQTNGRVFQSYLGLISDYENGKKKVFVDDYREAIFYLSFTTHIHTKAEYSSTFGYNSEKDFKDDMRLWKSWFKIDKWLLTDQYIDSVYKKFGIIYRKPEDIREN